jgi:hypothetical protein
MTAVIPPVITKPANGTAVIVIAPPVAMTENSETVCVIQNVIILHATMMLKIVTVHLDVFRAGLVIVSVIQHATTMPVVLTRETVEPNVLLAAPTLGLPMAFAMQPATILPVLGTTKIVVLSVP